MHDAAGRDPARASRGEFDEPALIREARADPDGRVSRTHADYFADRAIRIATAGCVAGRGIVATADLPANTLLVAAKALCSTPLADGADGANLRSIDPYPLYHIRSSRLSVNPAFYR